MKNKISQELQETFSECQKDIKKYIGTATEITEDIRDSEEFLRSNKIGIYAKISCFSEISATEKTLIEYFLIWKRSTKGTFRIYAQSSNGDFSKPLIEMPLLYRQYYHQYLPFFIKEVIKNASKEVNGK